MRQAYSYAAGKFTRNWGPQTLGSLSTAEQTEGRCGAADAEDSSSKQHLGVQGQAHRITHQQPTWSRACVLGDPKRSEEGAVGTRARPARGTLEERVGPISYQRIGRATRQGRSRVSRGDWLLCTRGSWGLLVSPMKRFSRRGLADLGEAKPFPLLCQSQPEGRHLRTHVLSGRGRGRPHCEHSHQAAGLASGAGSVHTDLLSGPGRPENPRHRRGLP